MEFNWLGVAFVSDNVQDSTKIEEELDEYCDYLRAKAQYELDKWLEARGLEQVMGVIVKKGSV